MTFDRFNYRGRYNVVKGFPHRCLLYPQGSVTPAVVSRLLTECLGKSDFADESLLLWDAAPDHLQRAVETELAERRLHVVNIPGGSESADQRGK